MPKIITHGIGNDTYTTLGVIPQEEYTFLNRIRPSEANCTLLGGQYYPAINSGFADCVVEFGHLGYCFSWEVHGMGHSLDEVKYLGTPLDDGTPVYKSVFTRIPFVNYSLVSDPCRDRWYGVTCEDNEMGMGRNYIANRTVTQLWLYSNNLQGRIPVISKPAEKMTERDKDLRDLFSMQAPPASR